MVRWPTRLRRSGPPGPDLPPCKPPPPFPVYYSMADYWQTLIEELVLALLEDLLERPHVWEAEAWLAGVSVEELLAL